MEKKQVFNKEPSFNYKNKNSIKYKFLPKEETESNYNNDYQNKSSNEISKNKMDLNESIFSFRYLEKEKYYRNNKKPNNPNFINEYEEAIDALKEKKPDVYFKHKLETIQTKMDKLKSKYTNSSQKHFNKVENNIPELIENYSINYLFAIIIIIIIIMILLHLYLSETEIPQIKESTGIGIAYIFNNYFNITNLFVFILIIFTLIFFLYKMKYRYQKENIKLTADRCIFEIENILKQKEEGSLIEIDQFAKLYCDNNKISRKEFNETIMSEIRNYVNSGETNLSEIEINGKSYLKSF
jgi:hypothetical protein